MKSGAWEDSRGPGAFFTPCNWPKHFQRQIDIKLLVDHNRDFCIVQLAANGRDELRILLHNHDLRSVAEQQKVLKAALLAQRFDDVFLEARVGAVESGDLRRQEMGDENRTGTVSAANLKCGIALVFG
jgi:hypothetical protein